MCWVIKVANWLGVPLIVTAEDIPRTGNVSGEVAEILPSDTKIYNKMTFGLADQPDILEAVQQTQRKTAVMIGYETDVCVTHSALGLMDLGYRVAVVADATGSPGECTPNWPGTDSRCGWNYPQREEPVLRMGSYCGKGTGI